MMDQITLYFVIPVLIFLARILDVSISTLRVIFTAKGYKSLAPILGFFEVLIWLAAFNQVMNNLNNVFCYIMFAAGFATGTYVGMIIEEKLSIGKVIVRIVTKRDASDLLDTMKYAGFNVTGIEAVSNDGDVRLILTVLNRKNLPDLLALMNQYNPNAFYTIEDIRYAKDITSVPAPSPVAFPAMMK